MDVAGPRSAERERCFRFIYDEHGKPENCPEPPLSVVLALATVTDCFVKVRR